MLEVRRDRDDELERGSSDLDDAGKTQERKDDEPQNGSCRLLRDHLELRSGVDCKVRWGPRSKLEPKVPTSANAVTSTTQAGNSAWPCNSPTCASGESASAASTLLQAAGYAACPADLVQDLLDLWSWLVMGRANV